MIYIIRHGQTAKNKENVLQGRSDTPLNETGIRQAQEAAEWFRAQGIRLDVVYSSPLQRAVRTAEIILEGQSPQGSPGVERTHGEPEPQDTANLPGEATQSRHVSTNDSPVPIIIDNRLIEMDYGPYEGMDLTSPPPEIVTFFSDFAHNPAPEGMEPLDDVVSRLGEFLEYLKAAEHPNILLSTHAIAMKGALEYLTPDSHGSYWPKYIGNCEVYAFDYQDGHFSVPHRCYYRV